MRDALKGYGLWLCLTVGAFLLSVPGHQLSTQSDISSGETFLIVASSLPLAFGFMLLMGLILYIGKLGFGESGALEIILILGIEWLVMAVAISIGFLVFRQPLYVLGGEILALMALFDGGIIAWWTLKDDIDIGKRLLSGQSRTIPHLQDKLKDIRHFVLIIIAFIALAGFGLWLRIVFTLE